MKITWWTEIKYEIRTTNQNQKVYNFDIGEKKFLMTLLQNKLSPTYSNWWWRSEPAMQKQLYKIITYLLDLKDAEFILRIETVVMVGRKTWDEDKA